jgi:DNA adenine methylase
VGAGAARAIARVFAPPGRGKPRSRAKAPGRRELGEAGAGHTLAEPNRRKDLTAKPFIKWAGGKRQLLPALVENLPENAENLRYYEPFLGGGALFFALRPGRAEINDSNTHLVTAYTVVRDHIDELVEALKRHKSRNSEKYYYQVREQDRDEGRFAALSAVERAARLIYLNKTCFNGLYRVNSRGQFNVPYGNYANPPICDEAVLRAASGRLGGGGVKILNCDFEAAVGGAGEGAFVYFDPPYHSPKNTSFTGYQAGGFGEDEQERLMRVFSERTNKGAKCLLSNSDTRFVRELYADRRFEIIPLKARRAINSDSAGRGEVGEVLVKNWR